MAEVEDAAVDPVEDEAPVETPEVDTEDDETEVESEAEESEVEAKSEEEDEPSDSSPEKKGDKFQERIDQVTRKYREQERKTLELEQQLRARVEEPPREMLQPDKSLADFEYDEAAFSTYLTDFAKQAAEAEVQKRTVQEAQQRKMAAFSVKESEFAGKAEDYHIVTRNPDLPITGYMVEALQTAEKGPDLLYYLGKNPDVTRGLSMMAPLDMARELGRLEAVELVKPGKSNKAPAPPPPKIKPTASPERVNPGSEASDKLSDREWLRRRNKQLAARDK